jgi:hypothetical protein
VVIAIRRFNMKHVTKKRFTSTRRRKAAECDTIVPTSSLKPFLTRQSHLLVEIKITFLRHVWVMKRFRAYLWFWKMLHIHKPYDVAPVCMWRRPACIHGGSSLLAMQSRSKVLLPTDVIQTAQCCRKWRRSWNEAEHKLWLFRRIKATFSLKNVEHQWGVTICLSLWMY